MKMKSMFHRINTWGCVGLMALFAAWPPCIALAQTYQCERSATRTCADGELVPNLPPTCEYEAVLGNCHGCDGGTFEYGVPQDCVQQGCNGGVRAQANCNGGQGCPDCTCATFTKQDVSCKDYNDDEPSCGASCNYKVERC